MNEGFGTLDVPNPSFIGAACISFSALAEPLVMPGSGWHNGIMLTDGEYTPSPVEFISQYVEKYEGSNGVEGYFYNGRPVVLLTSKGAKTGRTRKVPVMRIEHDGQYALVGSSAGSDKNPGWYYNILSEPRVQIQDGSVKRDFVAREISGDERSVWWSRAIATWPEFEEYTRMTARTIPLFVLTEVDH